MRRYGGTAADAQDIFHDALVIFREKALTDALPTAALLDNYLLGICRHLWQRERLRRRQYPHATLTDTHYQELAAAPPDPADSRETPTVLAQLERLGERCRTILLAFYYFQKPLTQIAATHHCGTVRSATVQKFKCLERLRNAVKATTIRDFAA